MQPLIAVSLLAALTGCAAQSDDLPTQSGINLDRYAGTWYEQARLPNRFQNDCVGDVRADYTVQPNGMIKVANQCRAEDGDIKVAQGAGRMAPAFGPPDPARLEVRFAPTWTSWLPMVWGDYWIIRLEGDYQYSLVGTPDRKYLWVLSRDRRADAQTVDRLLSHARTLGFDVGRVVRTGN